MATTETEQKGIGESTKLVAEHVSTIIRLELELASIEIQRKLRALGMGIGFAFGAAILALFLVGFAFATLAAGLATFLPWWASLLIVTGLVLLLGALLAWLAVRSFKKGAPPVPNQAIEEARLTKEILTSDGKHA